MKFFFSPFFILLLHDNGVEFIKNENKLFLSVKNWITLRRAKNRGELVQEISKIYYSKQHTIGLDLLLLCLVFFIRESFFGGKWNSIIRVFSENF